MTRRFLIFFSVLGSGGYLSCGYESVGAADGLSCGRCDRAGGLRQCTGVDMMAAKVAR